MAKAKAGGVVVIKNDLVSAPDVNLRERPKIGEQKGLYQATLRDISNHEIIRPRDLPLICGLSRTTCWRLSKDPMSGFPPKIRLSAGAVGFSRESIEIWLKSREEG
ncbi:MAG: hypothetical protein A2075_23845 [Geobacteraceae bacterium GWC2_58_44]|nr:MAG: hypothetical protein A2075_23845 [Geobacteraceae bacterium GWC2_58_44]